MIWYFKLFGILLAAICVLFLLRKSRLRSIAWDLKKRIGMGNGMISIMEVKNLDMKRKIVLFKCCEKSYLILIGGGHDILLNDKVQIPEQDA